MKSRFLRAVAVAVAAVVFSSSSFAAPPKHTRQRDGGVLQKIVKAIKSIKNLIPVTHEDLGPPKP
jgi:hypothetical protein